MILLIWRGWGILTPIIALFVAFTAEAVAKRMTADPVAQHYALGLGFILAAAFQCSIIAFIARSATPRQGTTIFETTIGLSGLAPLAAGKLTDYLKASGTDKLAALRAPFYFAIALIGLTLLLQLILLPSERARRNLATTQQ